MNWSGQPIRTTGVDSLKLLSSSKTALPKPPRKTWSSSVGMTSTLRAKNSSISTSIGFVKRALITAAEIPSLHNLRAISSAIGTSAPGANGNRTVPVHGREEHVGQLVLVLGHHVDHVGDAAEIADVEQAVVRGTVVGREAAAIQAENHRQVLQADIVNDRIESALQEGRVNRAEGFETLGGQAGGE